MYHQVTPHPHPAFQKYSVTPKVFAAQMNWLAQTGYVPINLDNLLDYRNGHGTMPPRSVIITFDDGFKDCIDYVVPILQARGFTAVFYLIAGLIGNTSRWLAERGIELPIIDWPTARKLKAAGFQCGAHSLNHTSLTHISTVACHDELRKSRLLLEDHLGHEVRHMAYPFGCFNETVRAIVAETGYRSACSVRIGLSTPDDDPLALHRVHVNGQDSLVDFICKLHTARAISELLRCKVRDGLRRIVYPRMSITQ
jgi:peptidoglycan/xylan/chitin deacetylase (PgdA/CDA1 family)